MSGDSTNQRRESEHYYYASNDPHTAIPDWVPFCHQLGQEARNLIVATLILQKNGDAPTRRQLATALGVDERSIYRWLKEIAAAGAVTTSRTSRRINIVFRKPKPDRTISDRSITDRTITDRSVRFRDSDSSEHVSLGSHETTIPDRTISDPSVGVGVGQHVGDSDSTTTNRAPLKTALARWLKRAGMNAAREFDDLALDYATYREFVEHKRSLGWEWRQIVSTLREAPLDGPVLTDDPQVEQRVEHLSWEADDQADAGDELARLDSTSAALARRFEADRLEALARGAGIVDYKGVAK